MIDYDPTVHEPLLTHWYYQLRGEPEEFANLFAEPLRNLTELLFWAKRSVKLVFAHDGAGLWGACWVEPMMSGAFFGCWIRKSHRGTLQAYALARGAQRAALEQFPVLISITKQPRLDEVQKAYGFELVGQVPYLFDGNAVLVYHLTKDGFTNVVRRRKILNNEQRHPKPLRGGLVEHGAETVSGDSAGSQHTVKSASISPPNRRRKFKYTPHKPKRGRRKTGPKSVDGTDAAGASADGTGE